MHIKMVDKVQNKLPNSYTMSHLLIFRIMLSQINNSPVYSLN